MRTNIKEPVLYCGRKHIISFMVLVSFAQPSQRNDRILFFSGVAEAVQSMWLVCGCGIVELWGFFFVLSWVFLSGLQEVLLAVKLSLVISLSESLLIFACYTRHFTTIKCSLNFVLLLKEASGTKLKLGHGKMFYSSLFDKSVFLMCLDAYMLQIRKWVMVPVPSFLCSFIYMCKIMESLIIVPLSAQNQTNLDRDLLKLCGPAPEPMCVCISGLNSFVGGWKMVFFCSKHLHFSLFLGPALWP